jgi:hypothetical protein
VGYVHRLSSAQHLEGATLLNAPRNDG